MRRDIKGGGVQEALLEQALTVSEGNPHCYGQGLVTDFREQNVSTDFPILRSRNGSPQISRS